MRREMLGMLVRDHEGGESKPLRSEAERLSAASLVRAFEGSGDDVSVRLDNFPKYVRRQSLTRFLALYELFKLVETVKGSVIECGVNRGFGLMAWAKLSAIIEPVNLTRRIYGFDTFSGFPEPRLQDLATKRSQAVKKGDLAANSLEELESLISIYDQDRFLGHVDKVHVVAGDAAQTIPQFMKETPHLVVSLLFLDFDLYEPTRVALENFVPRMPRGAVIAFDELDNPLWPGETTALMDSVGIGNFALQRFPFDPYIAYAKIA